MPDLCKGPLCDDQKNVVCDDLNKLKISIEEIFPLDFKDAIK